MGTEILIFSKTRFYFRAERNIRRKSHSLMCLARNDEVMGDNFARVYLHKKIVSVYFNKPWRVYLQLCIWNKCYLITLCYWEDILICIVLSEFGSRHRDGESCSEDCRLHWDLQHGEDDARHRSRGLRSYTGSWIWSIRGPLLLPNGNPSMHSTLLVHIYRVFSPDPQHRLEVLSIQWPFN